MFTTAVGRKSESIYKKETNKPSRNFCRYPLQLLRVFFFITVQIVTRLYCAWLGRQKNVCKVASTVLLFIVNGPSICVVHVVMKSFQCDVNSTYKLFVTK